MQCRHVLPERGPDAVTGHPTYNPCCTHASQLCHCHLALASYRPPRASPGRSVRQLISLVQLRWLQAHFRTPGRCALIHRAAPLPNRFLERLRETVGGCQKPAEARLQIPSWNREPFHLLNGSDALASRQSGVASLVVSLRSETVSFALVLQPRAYELPFPQQQTGLNSQPNPLVPHRGHLYFGPISLEYLLHVDLSPPCHRPFVRFYPLIVLASDHLFQCS